MGPTEIPDVDIKNNRFKQNNGGGGRENAYIFWVPTLLLSSIEMSLKFDQLCEWYQKMFS